MWQLSSKMDSDPICRLCFKNSNQIFIDIFGETGCQLHIPEIIAEHFKCQVSSAEYSSSQIVKMSQIHRVAIFVVCRCRRTVHFRNMCAPNVGMSPKASTNSSRRFRRPNSNFYQTTVKPNVIPLAKMIQFIYPNRMIFMSCIQRVTTRSNRFACTHRTYIVRSA